MKIKEIFAKHNIIPTPDHPIKLWNVLHYVSMEDYWINNGLLHCKYCDTKQRYDYEPYADVIFLRCWNCKNVIKTEWSLNENPKPSILIKAIKGKGIL